MGATLSWEGRNLTSYETDAVLIQYEYDENGMRYRSTVTTKETGAVSTYEYVWSDGKLISIVFTGGDLKYTAKYLYGDLGEPVGMVLYDGESTDTYLFAENMHGDITRIVNANGSLIVSYTYDMHGNRTATYNSDTSNPMGFILRITQMVISTMNPFGYRGYCYDVSTGLYYLQSRYYDPNTGRFINADSTDYLNVSGTVLGCNLFIYCENDPVNNVDPTGTASINLTNIKFNVFAYWARSLLKVWNDGYEKKLISVSNGSVTMYLSVSVATTVAKLKTVSFSSQSITISGKNFSTSLGVKKVAYSVSAKTGILTTKISSFTGRKGYGLGISFVSSIYSKNNKKIGEVSVNIVVETTYLMLAAVAVTVAGLCVVVPAVIPLAKELIKTFSVLSKPQLLLAYVYTFSRLANNLAAAY